MANLTVADLKAHLNIDPANTADDALLAAKIDAAEMWVNAYVGQLYAPGNWDAPAVEAVRQLAAHLYENREASLVGITAQELPFGLVDLLAPYRSWAF